MHVPNKFKEPESYAHHLLFMVYPFCDECELKLGQPPSYSSKLNEPEVHDIISYNKSLVEPYSDLIDAAFLNYRSDIMPSWNPFSQHTHFSAGNDRFWQQNVIQDRKYFTTQTKFMIF